MKKLTVIAFLVLATASASFAQVTKSEQEVLKFNSEYEQAQINRDVAFFERVFADDYTFSGPTAEIEDKAKAIAWIRNEKEKPTYKMVSMKSENVKAKVMGNTAILTGDWTGTVLPVNDALAEPHADRGRYTAILEKRGGQWIVLAEHVSEAPHDRKLMEQQVLKASDQYTALIGKPDKAGLERLLADEFTYTNEEGAVRSKTEDVAMMTSGETVFTTTVASDRKVHVLSNSSAVETGTFHAVGTHKGKPFDVKERYTATWVWKNLRWQVAADHTSLIK